MGRPAPTLTTCQELHALLLQKGLTAWQRPQWDSLLVRMLSCSSATARVITQTGKDAGLWTTTHGSRAVEGTVTILATPPALPFLQGAALMSAST